MQPIEVLLLCFAAGRAVIGLAPMVAAPLVSRVLGFPDAHDNPSARVMARMFGVRDIGLGVIVVAAVVGAVPLAFAILFNAAMDVGDALVISVPLVRRQGIDRGAATSLLFALTGLTCWLVAYTLL